MRTFTGMLAVFAVLTLGCGDDDSGGDSNGYCSVDTDCKGDRICIAGECTDPWSGGTGGMDGGFSGTGGTGGEPTTCPNGSCDPGESCASCPEDCGPCADQRCGDGICSESVCETCANCPSDCDPCTQVGCNCGDGICDRYYCGEDSADCAQDCGSGGDDAGDAASEVTGPTPGLYLCGNGVCEPGETELCNDCLSVARTCDQPCTSNCDCAQPWTSCGEGANQVCSPQGCSECWVRGQFCCWCPADMCGNVSCVAPGDPCPSC
jgi:hypothetical protein